MTMDYSPWSEREIWLFLRVAVSPKPERSRPPKLMCVHLASIHTCMNFLSQFRSIKFFDDHGLYSSWSEGEIWPNLKSSRISETGESMPTKIGVHAFDINLYLHEFLVPIPIY